MQVNVLQVTSYCFHAHTHTHTHTGTHTHTSESVNAADKGDADRSLARPDMRAALQSGNNATHCVQAAVMLMEAEDEGERFVIRKF